MTLLAIDGPAGAGKTTFAAKLEAELSLKGTVKVIHMDDFQEVTECLPKNIIKDMKNVHVKWGNNGKVYDAITFTSIFIDGDIFLSELMEECKNLGVCF